MGDELKRATLPMTQKGRGRREVLQGLVGGIGAGLTIPALAETHPMQGHLKDHAKVAAADAKAGASPKPAFLDPHQMATLVSLAEAIVPGSTRAAVAPFVDQLLAVDTPEHQRDFLGALGAIEGESMTRFAHPWKALTEPQQVALLTAAFSQEPSRKDSGEWGTRRTSDASAPPFNLRNHADLLKGWIMGAYYSSEIGQRELGYDGNMFFASFPGCQHPGGHS
jgi:hypothetical protein